MIQPTDPTGLVADLLAAIERRENLARATTVVPVAGQWSVSQAKHPRTEDEAVSLVQGRDEVQPDYEGYKSGVPVIVAGGGWPDEADNEANLRHIAENDPATVLAGCEADRRVVQRHRPFDTGLLPIVDGTDEDGEPIVVDLEDARTRCRFCRETWPCADLLDRAAAYGLSPDAPAAG